jgi:endoglucanase
MTADAGVGGRRVRIAAAAMVASILALAGAGASARPGFTASLVDPGPTIKVNQLGYVVGAAKRASVVNPSTSPVAWSLVNSAGTAVATGSTAVMGVDANSGDSVHTVDFTAFDTPGTGYALKVGADTSYRFAISDSIYARLRYDALGFFYQMRSGTPIDAALVGAPFARPAGHVNVAPNTGDNNVPCRAGANCGYTLDVRGGWYDAGDQGKYVVNGGISAWQLLDEYERAVSFGNPAALADGTLAIPERANGVPDILDEARWEVEFLLKMQVPDGKPLAGMAHHKIHDQSWTGLGTAPQDDSQPRFLAPPSTAATLNLAAVAAQAARIWRTIDPAFSSRALTASVKAWTAAKANPVMLAPASDSTGGGPYDDADGTLADETYWAAAELFVTTGQDVYRTALTGSPLYNGRSFSTFGFDWNAVAALGDVTLAVVPNGLPAADLASLRARLVAAADADLALIASEGYPVPYSGGASGFVWGSNSQVLNNAAILGLANDFTGQAKYRNGVFETLDYILGRNPLNESYVTGEGTKFSSNEHHRFWANELNPARPHPPTGSMAGGPNSALQDPTAAQLLAGCRGEKCYLDDIQAYSVNEVAINWNAALAWVSAWAGEKEKAGAPADTTPPSAPGAPAASNVTQAGVTLTWAASTDADSGVAGYDVLRVSGATAAVVASSTTTSATVTGLAAGTAYTFAVVARDTAGLTSARSATVSVTTASGPPPASCRLVYSASTAPTTFTANLALTNTGTTTITSWTLGFHFPGNQRLTQSWSATWTQTGADVTATNLSWNGTLTPGQSTTFGFNGSFSGANVNPAAFTLNGGACATS